MTIERELDGKRTELLSQKLPIVQQTAVPDEFENM